MRTEVMIELPILISDFVKIKEMLEGEGLICSPFRVELFNEYSIESYTKEREAFDTEITALFDRNIFTDIISLARCENASRSKKLAAALMVFLQCSDVQIEPNIALYEFASNHDSSMALEELTVFRSADNISPKVYADIALDRKKSINENDLNHEFNVAGGDDVNFEKQLKHWTFNYTLILKLALTELEPITSHQKMSKFMEWMFNEFYFGAAATLFASHFLSPKESRVTLKGLRSLNREKALSVLKNETWDLTLLTDWTEKVKRQKETNSIWLLCSRDKSLMKIARCLMVSGTQEISLKEERVKDEFIKNWGEKIGIDLYTQYQNLLESLEDKSRVANRSCSAEYFEKMRLKFEIEFLIWD